MQCRFVKVSRAHISNRNEPCLLTQNGLYQSDVEFLQCSSRFYRNRLLVPGSKAVIGVYSRGEYFPLSTDCDRAAMQTRTLILPHVQPYTGPIIQSISGDLTLRRTSSTPRNIKPLWSWIGPNLNTVMMSEASWSSPVTVENSLNTTLRLSYCCTPSTGLQKEMRTLDSDWESRWRCFTLHSPSTRNSSMVLTPSGRPSAMLQSIPYWTWWWEIACMLVLVNMNWARYSLRYKTKYTMYRVMCIRGVQRPTYRYFNGSGWWTYRNAEEWRCDFCWGMWAVPIFFWIAQQKSIVLRPPIRSSG